MFHRSSLKVCKPSFAEGEVNPRHVPEVVLVVATTRYERGPKTGKQIVHLKWSDRYILAHSNVEPTANGHGKGIVVRTHRSARYLDQVGIGVRMRAAKKEFSERLEGVCREPELWPAHVCKKVAVDSGLRDQRERPIGVLNR